MCVSIMYLASLRVILFQCLDQLNTTIHGTMKTTPYKLVFGQPLRRNFFPGAKGDSIMEDVYDLFKEGRENDSGQEEQHMVRRHGVMFSKII